MDKEQQRIAIAEACGAKWYQWAGEYWITFKDWNARSHCYEADRPAETSNHPKIEVSVPDYLNDLNAMHDAEKILDANQWDSYRKNLAREWTTNDDDGMWAAINTTAAQRAEAFLRTLNLWKQ